MYRALLLCLAVTLAALAGCTARADKPPASGPVKGTIKLDGKPMPTGAILFEVSGQPPRTLTVTDGAYSGEVLQGDNKVQIMMYKDGPPLTTDPEKKPTKMNVLPARFNYQSKLTAKVEAAGANEFSFDVQSR